MKSLVMGLIAALTVAAYAEESASTQLTAEEKAAKRERMLKQTGGIIQVQGDGALAVINKQKSVSLDALDPVLSAFKRNFQTQVLKIESETPFSIESAAKDLEASSGNAAVFVVESESLPMSLVSMEAKWALVNIKTLKDGDPSPEVLKERFYKEFQRMMYLVLGGGMTENSSVSPMRFVGTAKDLDAITGKGMDPATFMGMGSYMPKLGITRGRMAPYRKACREGWAPAPTNEYQKVIWEEYHAKPTEPMKVEFDPKKGE